MSELARYQVRTPMWLWLANGVFTSFCVLVGGALILYGGTVPGFLLVLMSILLTTTVAFWLTMSAYRVGGGRNLIRFYEDRVEVPSTNKRSPLVFPRAGTAIQIRDVVVKYKVGVFATIGSVRRGKLIELRNGAVARKISTLTLDDSADETALVADLQRFATGEPALGRAGHAAVATATRSSYDDRLDRELAQLE